MYCSCRKSFFDHCFPRTSLTCGNSTSSGPSTKGGERKDDFFARNHYPFKEVVCHDYTCSFIRLQPPQSRWSHSPFLLSGGKLNHRADPRAPSSPLCPNVSSFYLLIRAGPCWTTVNIVDQEDLFYYPSDSRHMQARVLTHAHHYQSPTCDLS